MSIMVTEQELASKESMGYMVTLLNDYIVFACFPNSLNDRERGKREAHHTWTLETERA